MTLEEQISQKLKEIEFQQNPELEKIIENLYDTDKIDFNTELSPSQILIFSELEVLTEGDDDFAWVMEWIKKYEKKSVSKYRLGRGEMVKLRTGYQSEVSPP